MRFVRRASFLTVLAIFVVANLFFSLSASAVKNERQGQCGDVQARLQAPDASSGGVQDCGNNPANNNPGTATPGDFPAFNMSDYMFMRQGRKGNIHLAGYAINFDTNNPNKILSVSPWGSLKTAQIEDSSDGYPQFVVIKGFGGRPLELYQVRDGKVFIVYEEMNWDNLEYREHRHRDGTLSFEWTRDNAKPYQVEYREHSDFTWHVCADASKDEYVEFEKYIFLVNRPFDLTAETKEKVETEMNEVDGTDSAWLDLPQAFGYLDAHVVLVVNDYYWGPLVPLMSEADKTNYQSRESHWKFHERYKYMALKLPDGSLFAVGFVGFVWFYHDNPNQPMVKQDGIFLTERVVEEPGKEANPLLSCVPHN